MKMKMLMLSFFLATACVQAEQIKVPSLETLKSRLDAFGNVHPEEGSVGRMLLEESGFLAEMADQELSSVYVASRLRTAALVIAMVEVYFMNNYEFFLNTEVPTDKARADCAVLAKKEALRLLKLKIEDSFFGNISFVKRHEKYDLYNYCVKELYSAFFKDHPKVLAEELAKFSSK